jgi:hypothetical protein
MGRFSEIANLAVPMLHNAVRSFVDGNADLAHATRLVEPRVNQMRDAISAELVEAQAQGRFPLEALTPLIAVARRYERVSDQAMNICEEALYYATGEYVRHLPREDFRVVFVDEAQGCVSRMAEAIACSLGAKRFSFKSAGLVAGAADPQAVWFLSQKGIDISHQKSASWTRSRVRSGANDYRAFREAGEFRNGPPKPLSCGGSYPTVQVRGRPRKSSLRTTFEY